MLISVLRNVNLRAVIWHDVVNDDARIVDVADLVPLGAWDDGARLKSFAIISVATVLVVPVRRIRPRMAKPARNAVLRE